MATLLNDEKQSAQFYYNIETQKAYTSLAIFLYRLGVGYGCGISCRPVFDKTNIVDSDKRNKYARHCNQPNKNDQCIFCRHRQRRQSF